MIILRCIIASAFIFWAGLAHAQSGSLREDLQAYEAAVNNNQTNRAAILASHLAVADFAAAPYSADELRDIRTEFAMTMFDAGYHQRAIRLLNGVIRETISAAENEPTPLQSGLQRRVLAERIELIGDWLAETNALDGSVNAYLDAHREWTGIYGNKHGTPETAGHWIGGIEHVYVWSLRQLPDELETTYGFAEEAQAHPNMAELTAKLVGGLRAQSRILADNDNYAGAIQKARLARYFLGNQCGVYHLSRKQECLTFSGPGQALNPIQLAIEISGYYQSLATQLEGNGDLAGAAAALAEAELVLMRYDQHLAGSPVFEKIRNELDRIFRLAEQRGIEILYTPSSIVEATVPYIGGPKDDDFETVQVFYGTNRALTGKRNLEKAYGSKRGGLTYGMIEMTVPKNRTVGDVGIPGVLDFGGAKDGVHIVLKRIDRKGSASEWTQAISKSLAATRKPEKEAFVYVHGHGVKFANAARRTVQLAVDLDIRNGATMFSWPAGHPLLGYEDSAEQVPAASKSLQKFLRALADESGADKIHIIAHSMGNRVLLPALQGLKSEYRAQRPALFDQIIWASPDNAADEFSENIGDVLNIANDMTVYISENDRALEISKWFKNDGTSRVGQAPPNAELLRHGDNLIFVDTTLAQRGMTDVVAHGDYAMGAMTDMRSIVWLSLKPSQRCIRETGSRSRGLTYWQTVYPRECTQPNLRRAIVAIRQNGPGEAGTKLKEMSEFMRNTGKPAEAADLTIASQIAQDLSVVAIRN